MKKRWLTKENKYEKRVRKTYTTLQKRYPIFTKLPCTLREYTYLTK